jgi:hypothetical protein
VRGKLIAFPRYALGITRLATVQHLGQSGTASMYTILMSPRSFENFVPRIDMLVATAGRICLFASNALLLQM